MGLSRINHAAPPGPSLVPTAAVPWVPRVLLRGVRTGPPKLEARGGVRRGWDPHRDLKAPSQSPRPAWSWFLGWREEEILVIRAGQGRGRAKGPEKAWRGLRGGLCPSGDTHGQFHPNHRSHWTGTRAKTSAQHQGAAGNKPLAVGTGQGTMSSSSFVLFPAEKEPRPR